jgi:hypothetical protein
MTLSERKRLISDVQSDDDAGILAVARYLADMTGQLESMARASKLELLAYLLAMARAEAESVALEARSASVPKPR